MDRVGIRELQQHASGVLKRVRAGEGVEVTDRGRLVAVLLPQRAGDSLQALRNAGRVSETDGDLLDLGPPLRRPAKSTGASERLQQMRSEER